MKKFFALLLCVLLVAVVFSGCCSGKTPSATSAPAATVKSDSETVTEQTEAPTAVPTATPAPEKTDVVVGEVATLSGMALQVTKVDKSQGTEFDKPKDGKEYVVVTVNIKNVGADTLTYNPFYFKMKNSQGQINDAAVSLVDTDTQLQSGELMPGGLVSGTVVFEEPKNDPALSFIYEDTALFSDKQITVDLSKSADSVEALTQDEVKTDFDKIANVGEENSLDGVSVTLNKVSRSAGDDFLKPKPGMEYVVVEVTIKNTGTEKIDYNPFDFKMQNSRGQQVSMTALSFASDTALNSGELAPGGTVTGTIAFEQPKGDTGLILVYEQMSLFSSKVLAFKVQ